MASSDTQTKIECSSSQKIDYIYKAQGSQTNGREGRIAKLRDLNEASKVVLCVTHGAGVR
jgi:hypothetical protein